ncbi:complex I NDUFA9 subunit family protein [soil metagenome]
MRHTSVLVLGGTGFIGRAIVARLAARGVRVYVPTRRYAHARPIVMLPTVAVVEADIHDPRQLQSLVDRCDAVINLVGIFGVKRGDPYGPDLARAHVDLPRSVVVAMKASPNARRFLHMSSLGASTDGPSMYLRSKGDGEAAVRGEAGDAIGVTIFRPSVVFGPEDRFLNLFAMLARRLPVLPIGRADSKLQPVHVGDVADAFVNALDEEATIGQAYPLVGPKVYTLREVVSLAATATGHPRPVIGLPGPIARLQAMFMEHAPGEPMLTRDNLDSMTIDSIAPAGYQRPAELGLGLPATVEQFARTHLGDTDTHFDRFRAQPRR